LENGKYTLYGTVQREVIPPAGRQPYRISVFQPAGEVPEGGFPVIYVLDANSIFATMVEALTVQSRRPEKTGVMPAVIVGIGYVTDEPFHPARFYDFTLAPGPEDPTVHPAGKSLAEQGGAENFLDFIEKELKPSIEKEFPVDRSRQTIFGHSLGGLFVLHALFTRPGTFTSYVAGSPSIHWNKRMLLAEEQSFESRLLKCPQSLGVLLAVGELEGGHPSRMVEHAREMSKRLELLRSYGLRVEYKEFEGEGHVGILPALVSRALKFASAIY
jgi:predicted alpha/beta superfamily hydrolase